MFDFKKYEAKAKTMTDAELLYVIRDCREAAEAMKGHNPEREGHYEDEAHTCAMEITRRRKGK